MGKGANYLLLDAARMKDRFSTARESGTHFDCLYEDKTRDDLAEVAPYLFTMDATAENLFAWVIENGMGDSWGTFVVSDAGFIPLINHFRKFLVTKTPRGKERYFRFYDPRVLKKILPGYDREQLINFFGPVEKLMVEGDTKDAIIEFTHQNGILKQRIVHSKDAF